MLFHKHHQGCRELYQENNLRKLLLAAKFILLPQKH